MGKREGEARIFVNRGDSLITEAREQLEGIGFSEVATIETRGKM